MIALLAGFAMGFLGSVPLTGPVALLVLQRGIARRYREGLAVGIGCGLAEGAYCGLAVFGFGYLLDSYPVVRPVSRGLSAVILLALGVWFVLSRLPARDTGPAGPIGAGRWLREVAQGAVITAVNPVIVLNWSAAVAVLHSAVPVRFTTADKVLFAVAAGVGIASWFATLLALVRRFGGRLPERVLQRVVQTMGAALLAGALWLGWDVARSLVAGGG